MALINLFVQHLGSMLSVIAEARNSGMSKPPSAAGIALDSMAGWLPCAGERSGDWGEKWPGLQEPSTSCPYNSRLQLAYTFFYYSIVLGLNVGPWAR